MTQELGKHPADASRFGIPLSGVGGWPVPRCLAASDSNTQASSSQSSNDQNRQNLPGELQKRLTDAGFTDVKVIPSSFVVQAKDKDGHPVVMQIGPDSMTILTAIPVNSSTTR